MPERPQGELAESLRRGGALGVDDFDRLLARAVSEMNGWLDCALLLTLAERHPSAAVKQALFYRCHHSEETSASCAAMLCFLCGKAASPFDPTMAGFFAQFGLHVIYYQRRDALEKLSELTGLKSAEVEDFARIERAFHELPPPLTPLSTSPAAPATATPAAPVEIPALRPPPLPKHRAASGGLAATYDIESDMRGETITYVEPGRQTTMSFFWTREYAIHADTITTWVYADRRTEPVTARQRVDIVKRVVEHAVTKQHTSLVVGGEEWMMAALRGEEIAAMRLLEDDLRRSTNDLRLCITLAYKWKDRVKQLALANQPADAINAYHRGVMWATQYASGATSGGEGVANSAARDEAIADLRDTLGSTRPGDDPTGDKARAAIGEGPLA